MLVTLDTPYVDAAATDLSFALGLDEQPALHVLDLGDAAGAGTRLQLRLLGASHQVLLDTPAGRISETVACLPGSDGVLPAVVQQELAGREYRFHAQVIRSRRRVRDAAQLYPRDWEKQRQTLVGLFPGDPQGLTMLEAELRAAPRQIRWMTWHTYPGSGELVETRSTVVMPQ
jgi:hypothetical protein